MSKILLIVEGAQEEKEFFEAYNKTFLEERISVVCFKQNIFKLYEICKEYIIHGIKPTNIIPIIKEAINDISDDERSILDQKYTDVFLIFDLDLQNHRTCYQCIEEYLTKISYLLDFFDNSTTIGQIVINYPMMESFMHIDDDNFANFKDFKVPFDIVEEGNYCNYLHSMNMNFPVKLLTKEDFEILFAYNLKKANYMLCKDYSRPSKETYEEILSQSNIFNFQKECLENRFLYALNCASFIDVELRGRKIYFNNDFSHLFNTGYLFLNNKYKKIHKFKDSN